MRGGSRRLVRPAAPAAPLAAPPDRLERNEQPPPPLPVVGPAQQAQDREPVERVPIHDDATRGVAVAAEGARGERVERGGAQRLGERLPAVGRGGGRGLAGRGVPPPRRAVSR